MNFFQEQFQRPTGAGQHAERKLGRRADRVGTAACWILTGVLFPILLSAGCRRQVTPSETEFPSSEVVSSSRKSGRNEVEKPGTISQNVQETPRQLLERMAGQYKSARSYADHGMVRVVGKMSRPEQEPASWPCTVAFQSPTKLRLEVNEGMLVCDGEDCFAQIRPLPEQVLRFPAPKKLSIEAVFQDRCLDEAMEFGIPPTILRYPPQLVLLLAEDPLKTLLPDGAEAEYLAPRHVNETACDLIRITHPTGTRILWIDRAEAALLRFDYLVEGLALPEGVESIRLIRVDLADARFNREIAREAFQMLRPERAREVARFEPIETLLLGRTLDSPESLRLETFAVTSTDLPGAVERGEMPESSVSLAELNDKVVVLCFWTTWSEHSPEALRELFKVGDLFQRDDRVRFFAVHRDETSEAGQDEPHAGTLDFPGEIRKALERFGLPLPPCRDVGGKLTATLSVDTFPTFVILAPKGLAEFYYRGIVPAAVLNDVVREILGGGKPHEKTWELLSRQSEAHGKNLRAMSERDYFAEPRLPEEPDADTKPAPLRPPKTFDLVERWSIDRLSDPGNIAVLPGKDRDENGDAPQPLLLVPCDGDFLAAIDLDGRIVRHAKPEGLLPGELLALVRTGIDGRGRRFIGVSSVGGNVVRVFDENGRPIFSWSPEQASNATISASNSDAVRDASETRSPEQVVSDIRFVDLRGDGSPALLSGMIAVDRNEESTSGDAIHVVDFHGAEIWKDETVRAPFLVDLSLREGKRSVYGLSVRRHEGTILTFDAQQGKRLPPLAIADASGEPRQVLWFHLADLDGDGQTELSVILSDRGAGTSDSRASTKTVGSDGVIRSPQASSASRSSRSSPAT